MRGKARKVDAAGITGSSQQDREKEDRVHIGGGGETTTAANRKSNTQQSRKFNF